ncbi:1476_t:CDS:2 [Scutellospora calospora]|uniref:1476_t:CDS:1 n=1 Tax=Scutellospora calospora TaxID=85575 RepID=A0ACA9JUZ0_9GLOM|nr:1476_t:CDS:2 [Scutellospora calospora]
MEDLRCENVFITEKLTTKLSNFYYINHIRLLGEIKSDKLRFLSPELLKSIHTSSEHKYNNEDQIFSFRILLIELLNEKYYTEKLLPKNYNDENDKIIFNRLEEIIIKFYKDPLDQIKLEDISTKLNELLLIIKAYNITLRKGNTELNIKIIHNYYTDKASPNINLSNILLNTLYDIGNSIYYNCDVSRNMIYKLALFKIIAKHNHKDTKKLIKSLQKNDKNTVDTDIDSIETDDTNSEETDNNHSKLARSKTI